MPPSTFPSSGQAREPDEVVLMRPAHGLPPGAQTQGESRGTQQPVPVQQSVQPVHVTGDSDAAVFATASLGTDPTIPVVVPAVVDGVSSSLNALAELKRALDLNLISQQDFDRKKDELLARI